MEITIKSAAEMAKVSRNTIYQAIRDGRMSRSPSGKVDSSEVLRVFGNPNDRLTRQEEREHIEHLKTQQQNLTPLNMMSAEKEALYQAQIKALEDTLRQAQEREQQHIEREEWHRRQIDKLTDSIKLLEAPKASTKPKALFDRLFGG